MAGTPFFRCQYVERSALPFGGHALIHGRFQIRRPNMLRPEASEFGPATRFKLDTGAVETAVDEVFAGLHGFGDIRQIGSPMTVGWFNDGATPLPAWRVYRWVRFRDHCNGLRGRAGDPGGIAHLEFRIAFIVVPAVTIPLPLLGLRDIHRYFTVGSAGDEYTFFARGSDSNRPAATDGGQGVREVP